MITHVNVEDRGSAEGYSDAFKEAEGDDAFRENEGDAFGENEDDDARGGGAEDAARDQEQGHANSRKKGQGRQRVTFEHVDGCNPVTIYLSDIPDALPWENDIFSSPLKNAHPTITN